MNTLLKDRTWWNANKRADAKRTFSKAIVDAFYDELQAGRQDPEGLREELITLPSADDGYSRVLFVGTTGAGKTSLLRQLIDSDPDEDRFPSTAPAKTTIADIEIVQSEDLIRLSSPSSRNSRSRPASRNVLPMHAPRPVRTRLKTRSQSGF